MAVRRIRRRYPKRPDEPAQADADEYLGLPHLLLSCVAAYCSAMAHRIMTLLERIDVEKDFAITGGIAKNVGVVTRLEKELGLSSLKSKYDTQIAGALGGALFAKALVEKQRKGS